MFILPEDRATLGSDPSAGRMTEVWGPCWKVRPFYFYWSHTLVFNALNPGGFGGWPPNKMIQILISRFVCRVKRRLPKGQLEFHLGGAWPITIDFSRLCIVCAVLLLGGDHGRYPLWICRKRKVDRCNLLLWLGYLPANRLSRRCHGYLRIRQTRLCFHP